MDGASFDRLSLLVHRLGDRATRRHALRTLAVSGITAALTQLRTQGAAAAAVVQWQTQPRWQYAPVVRACAARALGC